MLPLKTEVQQDLSLLCPGARRSFFCRMKYKSTTSTKDNTSALTKDSRCKRQTNSDKKYIVIHCIGHLKTWAQSKIGLKERESYGEGYSCNLSCLVAAGRAPPNVLQNNSKPSNQLISNTAAETAEKTDVLRNLQFLSRHTIDGKFLFIDQRATLVLGFLPQELLGTSMYEYYQYEDIPALAQAHKSTLQSTEKVVTSVYRFRTKKNDFVCLRSIWKTFKNPWTKEIESLMAKNSVVFDVIPASIGCSTLGVGPENALQIPGNFNFSNQSTNGREMHRVINTHVEAIKIGREIAERALDSHRKTENPVSSVLLEDTDRSNYDLPNSASVPDRINGISRDNGNITVPSTSANDNSVTELVGLISSLTLSETSNTGLMGNTEGNDEAAMALIMSLLEADAGLGGPVDYTGLPWPLP